MLLKVLTVESNAKSTFRRELLPRGRLWREGVSGFALDGQAVDAVVARLVGEDFVPKFVLA